MASTIEGEARNYPPRVSAPSGVRFMAYLAAIAIMIWSLRGSGFSIGDLTEGGPALADFLSRAWPPSLARFSSLFDALIETFQMALVGTMVGVVVALPLAIVAAKDLMGTRLLQICARSFFSFFRTVPDLVWALIFVIAVGLGPFAGTLAIAIETVGFCGRFFAETMEDVEKGPMNALNAQGVRRVDTIFCAILPAAMPAFITTVLFALEKATRSSVVLGLVGAGGIGLELKVAMDLFDYPSAMTIIMMIFVLVIIVEQFGSWSRRKVLEGQ